MSSIYITLVSSDTNMDMGYNCYLVDASGGNTTLTLPSILGDGQNFIVRRIDTNGSNTLTLNTSDSDTIDGLSSVQIGVGQDINVASCNSNWYTIAGNI